jgi:hypothetical protein
LTGLRALTHLDVFDCGVRAIEYAESGDGERRLLIQTALPVLSLKDLDIRDNYLPPNEMHTIAKFLPLCLTRLSVAGEFCKQTGSGAFPGQCLAASISKMTRLVAHDACLCDFAGGATTYGGLLFQAQLLVGCSLKTWRGTLKPLQPLVCWTYLQATRSCSCRQCCQCSLL